MVNDSFPYISYGITTEPAIKSNTFYRLFSEKWCFLRRFCARTSSVYESKQGPYRRAIFPWQVSGQVLFVRVQSEQVFSNNFSLTRFTSLRVADAVKYFMWNTYVRNGVLRISLSHTNNFSVPCLKDSTTRKIGQFFPVQ